MNLYEYASIAYSDFEKSFWLGHVTPKGYVLIARMVESYIDYIIRKNPEDFNRVGFIGTELYYNP